MAEVAPAALPVAEAPEQLLPEAPAAPHSLLDLEALEDALLCADIWDGKLPRWRRDAALQTCPILKHGK